MYKWCHESRRNYTFVKLKATKISKRCVFVLVTWPWRLPEEWPEACGSLTVVGAGTKHGFGTDPIRNPTIWLAESRNQVNLFAYRGRIGYWCIYASLGLNELIGSFWKVHIQNDEITKLQIKPRRIWNPPQKTFWLFVYSTMCVINQWC